MSLFKNRTSAEDAESTSNSSFNRIFKLTCAILFLACLATSVVLAIIGATRVNQDMNEYEVKTGYWYLFERTTTPDEEGYDEDSKICPVEYSATLTENGEEITYTFTYNYTYEEWELLGDATRFGDFGNLNTIGENRISPAIYREKGGDRIVGFIYNPSYEQFLDSVQDVYADEQAPLFSAAITLLILAISFAVMAYFGQHFTLYEKCWFLGIMVLAAIFAIIFPEESAGGVSGIVIMLLYLLDTFLNILCELLISKQSKWNFIVSVFVEITEILICVVLSYRFATMASTLFFWLPIDIMSFINWNRKKNTDTEQEELTKVRTLPGWIQVALIVAIGIWTIGIGYLLTRIEIQSPLFGGNDVLANIVCYLDACASAVGIVNGLAIFFRFRGQWIAWFTVSILEAIINILAGQYILLVLKFGYLTNTTYGFIKWTKYIDDHPEVLKEKTIF